MSFSEFLHSAVQAKSSNNPNPMPTPNGVPWQSSSCTSFSAVDRQPSLMEFNAQQSILPPTNNEHIYNNDYLPSFTNHFKRRSDSPPLPLPPAKQLITEEKIAEHFNSLSLSSNVNQYAYTENMDEDASTSTSTKYMFNNSKELEQKLKKAQRIIVCEEVRNKLNHTETIIPKVLLDMERSKCSTADCKALILWEPAKSLKSFIALKTDTNVAQQNNNEASDDEEIDNNNSSNFNNNNNNNSPNLMNDNNNEMEMDDL